MRRRSRDGFREGSAFLIGDAAHRVSPRGGTGMNTAIRDGLDIGWKLAWVLSGWAGDVLLDSYERERRPVVEHNLARSADPDGSLRETETELEADLGGRIAHAWVPSPAGRVSSLDLLDRGLTLFTGPLSAAWERAAAAVAGPVPITVRRLDAIDARRALALRADGALLARPDGTPAGRWPRAAGAEGALRAAVRSLTAGDRALAELAVA